MNLPGNIFWHHQVADPLKHIEVFKDLAGVFSQVLVLDHLGVAGEPGEERPGHECALLCVWQ